MSKETQVAELMEVIGDLQKRVAQLEAKFEAKRDVGERKMTDEDAERILVGDLMKVKHKDAAETLHLSYGQIYSARLGFTFKHVVKRLKDSGVKSDWF